MSLLKEPGSTVPPRSASRVFVGRAASQSAINILRIVPDRRLLLHQMMLRREVADRIGGVGGACERKSLAAPAAEIDVAALAALARLGQEAGAAECIEGGILLPDLTQRMVLDGPEFEARDRLGGVAR